MAHHRARPSKQEAPLWLRLSHAGPSMVALLLASVCCLSQLCLAESRDLIPHYGPPTADQASPAANQTASRQIGAAAASADASQTGHYSPLASNLASSSSPSLPSGELIFSAPTSGSSAPAAQQSSPSSSSTTTTTTSTTTTTTAATTTRSASSSSSPPNSVNISAPKSQELADTKQPAAKQPARQPASAKRVPAGGKFASAASAGRAGADNRLAPARDPIDQMSTSQSVSFAEPAVAATNQLHRQQQQQQQPQPHQQQAAASSNSNRWTHFGARLRPLVSAPTTTKAASAEGGAAFNVAAEQREHASLQRRPGPLGERANGGNQLAERDDDADHEAASRQEDSAGQDDQDNEALLYKMMQQQGLLTSSMWQRPQLVLGGQRDGSLSAAGLDDAGAANSNNNRRSLTAAEKNNNRVIKLLKSYSHIHQVDDSDDQIRGTYTKLRAPSSSSGWQRPPSNRRQQQQQQQQRPKHRASDHQQQNSNRNRPNGGQQQQRARSDDQHIFVSSQPLATARANFNDPAEPMDEPKSLISAAANNNNNNNHLGGSDDAPPISDGGDDEGSSEAPPGESEDEFECPNNGIFADEQSGCQAYHVCQSGAQVQQKFQCPLGTLFNNIILTCDFAHNVQCGGSAAALKTKQPQEIEPFGGQDQIRRRQPEQQASSQMDRGSQPPLARPAPVYQSQPQNRRPQQQQQLHRQEHQATGPRHLKIGSQYIPRQQQQQQHQQRQPARPQTAAAQAVNVYPPAPAPKSADSSPDSANFADESDDNEPVAPLVPATLPPRPFASSTSQLLPYNPPPAAANRQQQRQTAHRSQYPQQLAQNGQNQQSYQPAAYFGGHDEPASSASPIVVSGDQQQFNLVINHGAPTRQQAPLPAAAAASKPISDHKNSLIKPGRETAAAKKFAHQLIKKQQAAPSRTAQRMQSVANRLGGGGAGDNLRQQSSTQPSVVAHVETDANINRANFQRPPLVDLSASNNNNNNGNLLAAAPGGISADALNDGMLLLVRHGPANGASETISSIRLDDNRSQQNYGNQLRGQQVAGQAFAVDPSIVSPNSPIDAQLFPNVQSALAATQSPYSQASTQFVQHADRHQKPESVSATAAAAAIGQPLPRLEPPKPNNPNSDHRRRQQPNRVNLEHRTARQLSEQQQANSGNIQQQQQQPAPPQYQGELLKSAASAPSAASSRPTTTTTIATTTAAPAAVVSSTSATTGRRASQEATGQQAVEQKARNKRNKRLRAVSSPTSGRPAGSTTTSTTASSSSSSSGRPATGASVDVVAAATVPSPSIISLAKSPSAAK